MKKFLLPTAFAAVILNAAIFGFFYAWICSTMWGLDNGDPKVAIAAMQVMNTSVRNIVFAPAFFATPFVLLLVGGLAFKLAYKDVAMLFGAAGLLYLVGGMLLTMFINVPMNNALGLVSIPESANQAKEIWVAYSGKWQFWNQARTFVSGLALLLACIGLLQLGKQSGKNAASV